MSIVQKISYEKNDPRFADVDRREVLRYAGQRAVSDPDANALLENALQNVLDALRDACEFRVCYLRAPITWRDERPTLPFPCESRDLAKCLRGSVEVVLFAATVGIALDRAIARAQYRSMTDALLMQAYGAERIERLCDVFADEIARDVEQRGWRATPRFSPGYGDLPLTLQNDMIRILDASRKIGVGLNDSMLLSPSKSVTAIFGLGQCVGPRAQLNCARCDKIECAFRRENDTSENKTS